MNSEVYYPALGQNEKGEISYLKYKHKNPNFLHELDKIPLIPLLNKINGFAQTYNNFFGRRVFEKNIIEFLMDPKKYYNNPNGAYITLNRHKATLVTKIYFEVMNRRRNN
jgi:hypothetical protein